MSAKIVLVLCALVALVSSVPAPGGGVGAWGGGGGWGGGWGGVGGGGWGGVGGWGGAAAGPGVWGIPPWVAAAPWYPQWVPCTVVGSTCLDCTTKVVCTKVGGLQRACTDPTLPYCNAGACSATPAAGCGAPAVNADAPAAPAAPAAAAAV